MAGRRTICTPEVIKAVCDNITLGLSNHDAAVLAGIAEATFYGWLKRGELETQRVAETSRRQIRQRERPFVEFLEAVKKAKSVRKQVLIGRIQKAAQGGTEYTETKTVHKGGKVVEETITTKRLHPEWTAAAWLLERMHPDEFGRRQRVDVYDWRQEVVEMLQAGAITPQDVYEQLGHEYATDVLKSAGIVIFGNGQSAEGGKTEDDTNKDEVAD